MAWASNWAGACPADQLRDEYFNYGDDDDVFQESLVVTQNVYNEGVETGEFECRQDCLVLAGIVKDGRFRLVVEVLLLSVPPVRKCGKS